MQTGYYSNTGGMVTQFNRLDVISNNLANINTTAFKKDNVVIGDYMRLFQENADILPLENHTRQGAKFLNRSMVRVPHIVEEFTDFTNGAVAHTQNPLDLVITKKEAFFSVQTPDGVRYTRNGNFTLNENGTITTQEGYELLGTSDTPIVIDGSRKINITSDGNVYLVDPTNLLEQNNVGQIKIVTFDNPKYLKKMGDSLYKANKPEKLLEGENLVAQGYIEKSNVNGVTQMTSLIETNRLVGMYQKVMDTHMNDLNSDAINKLGSTR